MACNIGKRTCELMTEVGNASVSKKYKGHWSQGLLASINDPNLIVEEDDLTVTIKDKYAKVNKTLLVPDNMLHLLYRGRITVQR